MKKCSILIDDRILVRRNWGRAAIKNGVELDMFAGCSDLFSCIDKYSKDSTIYIDSELGDGIRGEVEAEKMIAHGYINIYIVTEKEAWELPPKWRKRVIKKDPPWDAHRPV